MRGFVLFVAGVLLFWGNVSDGAPSFRAIDLGAFPGNFERSEAYAVNSAGQVVGTSSASNSNRAVFWSVSASPPLNDLGVLPDMRSSRAFSLNDHGQVVGISVNGDRQRAFLWNPDSENAVTGTLVELDNL